MANRQLFRTILLQTLYEWDVRGYDNTAISHYLGYTLSSFNDSDDDDGEILSFAQEIVKKHTVIDEIIEKAAPDWPLKKISTTDRNVLRLGLYELLFGDHAVVPPKVAINEAVELAKRFGGPKSNKFVNGILGAVYREIGEPGKDQTTKPKMPETPYEEMPIDQKGAAVLYSVDQHDVVRIGMVHDVFGYWTLSKGGIKEGETPTEGTIRAIKEETDWTVEIMADLGDNEYIAYHPERGPVRKHVEYFLAKSVYTQPTLEVGSGGLDDVRWFELDDITDLNIYEDVSKMLIKAMGMITELTGKVPGMPAQEIQEKVERIAASLKETENVVTEHVDVASMKVAELKALAKERGLSAYTALKKAELIKLLSE
ncbi:MAG: N utilization substance protein B [Candidatus Paceibacteria bacterium]|jgi:N utilization substance protein B